MAYTFTALKPEYARLWRNMTVKREGEFSAVAARLLTHMDAYRMVEAETGVPASLVAVIHQRESSASFSRHLHNGDPLSARTIHVPAGRPRTGSPPFSWQASAADAMRYQGLDKIRDWSVERALFVLEGYNGFGYRNKGLPSPYLWAGTNNYTKGKYVADGVFDPNKVDTQLGTAGMLRVMWDLDPSTAIGKAVQPVPVPPASIPAAKPKPPPTAAPSPPTLWARIWAALRAVFLFMFSNKEK